MLITLGCTGFRPQFLVYSNSWMSVGRLTSVIILPRVLFLSRWLALFCFCCSTRSLVVRYSSANSLRILLKRWTLTSLIAYGGWPRNNRNEWNLEIKHIPTNVKRRTLYTVWVILRGLCVAVLVYDPPMDDLKNDDPLRTVFKEVRHALLKSRLHLMFGDHLQVVPGCLAATLHLTQVLLQLVKVNLERTRQTWSAEGKSGLRETARVVVRTLAERVMAPISE